MNSVELGKRIKEARIAKKMTQSEVVGNFITRNMLSQIESGSATPSIKTLAYLSQILEVPLNQLMPDQKDDALFVLEKAKGYLADESYEKVIAIADDYPAQLADEFYAIFSIAFYNLSKKSLLQKNYQEAAAYSQQAIEYAEKGIYANATVKSESIMVLNEAAEKLSIYYKDLSNR